MEKEFSIEEVLDDIRKEIAEKGLVSDILSFSDVAGISSADGEDFSGKKLEMCIADLNGSCVITESRRIEGSPLIVFIKRVIRKLTRFYVKPIVDAQNEFNEYTVRTANMLSRYVYDNSEKRLEEKIEALELKLQAAANENKMLISRIEALEAALSLKI
jgi:hypothetical protein